MDSIYEETEEFIANLTPNEKVELVLGFFKSNFEFILTPLFIDNATTLPDLNWQKIKYTEHAQHDFPQRQGVYMFSVSFDIPNLPTNSYVLYVGKAGDVDSNNTIAKRFRDYVRPSGYSGRPKVRKMIKYFKEHLFYHYAEVDQGTSTAEVEEALADVFVPPCNQTDFSAQVRSFVRGVRL
ncbi:hypothetical protein MHM98_14985 [Psychrobium sp. MM17-31]|uniref:hypothetical protein n=1 Tax=Psychrobium sp. MM17-31 TaxID=2917758 RepID=UPI001EF48C56|nr:hypothetical protein [Psychrobium sp. MM17-31]MCG7532637.1 hypothetical protein [Psychrobium sp. MM17-31]